MRGLRNCLYLRQWSFDGFLRLVREWMVDFKVRRPWGDGGTYDMFECYMLIAARSGYPGPEGNLGVCQALLSNVAWEGINITFFCLLVGLCIYSSLLGCEIYQCKNPSVGNQVFLGTKSRSRWLIYRIITHSLKPLSTVMYACVCVDGGNEDNWLGCFYF